MQAATRPTIGACQAALSYCIAGCFSSSSLRTSGSLSLPGYSISRNCGSCVRLCSSSQRHACVQCSDPQRETGLNLPVCERRASHTTSVEELLKWRNWAQQIALSVGDKYRILDGGPDSSELLRELEWMLQDTVSHAFATKSAVSPVWHTLKSPSPPDIRVEASSLMQPDQFRCSQDILTWERIKTLESTDLQKVVCLRASLRELSELWTDRVQHRRPFQYVVGCAHWRDLILFVKEGVLIPRPETEQIIDIAQEVMNSDANLAKGVWADLGTGSGALAIGLRSILHPEGNVLAVDSSDESIFIASVNIQRYGLQDKVKLLKGSWFSPLENLKGKLAGIVSNPPYIPSSHIATLQAEVGQYEPRSALDGGPEGIDDLAVICKGASWALQSGGYVILETNGGGQAEAVANALTSSPGLFCDVQLVKDFAGIIRFVRAMRV